MTERAPAGEVVAPPAGDRPRRRDHPGWRMVGVLAVTETIGYAALHYCFAVMVAPMRHDLGATTAQLAGAMTVAMAVGSVAAVPVGRWVDRHGARGLMTAGSLLGAGAVVAWSQARSLPELYAAFVGVGLAGAAVLDEPAFAVITTWFGRERRAALLAMTVVAGFSSTIFVPASQAMVGRIGWRDTLLVLAALLGACALPHALVLRPAPARPSDGDAEDVGGSAAVVAAAGDPRRSQAAVRRLTGAAVLQTVAVTAVAVHLVSLLRDTGLSAGAAATASGALGVLSVAGRLMLVRGAARAGLVRLAAALVAGQAVGAVALLSVPGPAGVVVFVVLFGAGFGVMTIARAALLGTYVPTGAFGSVSGRQALAAGSGRVVAPVATGVLLTSGGPGAALAAVALCSLGAAALLLLADRSAHPRPVTGARRHALTRTVPPGTARAADGLARAATSSGVSHSAAYPVRRRCAHVPRCRPDPSAPAHVRAPSNRSHGTPPGRSDRRR